MDDLLDQSGVFFLVMGQSVPVDVGGKGGFRVTGSALHRVDVDTVMEQDRDRGMARVMEADLRWACVSQELFEGSGDLGLANLRPIEVVKIIPYSCQRSPARSLCRACF